MKTLKRIFLSCFEQQLASSSNLLHPILIEAIKLFSLIPKHLFQFRTTLVYNEIFISEMPGDSENALLHSEDVLVRVMVQAERSHALEAADGAVQ